MHKNLPLSFQNLRSQMESKVTNGQVNIHFGVHKTGTTYIQENLEKICDPNFFYCKLDDFRKFRREKGYLRYLKTLDYDKKIVISDENMIGGNGTILTGRLYPNLKSNINKFINPFKNRDLVNIFISIRPMTSLLPSQYCEYLRWYEYISYNDFTAKASVQNLKWMDVLSDTILFNDDIIFFLFDFTCFNEKKNSFLSKISFGLMTDCSPSVKRSRASFTNNQIYQLSKGKSLCKDDKKFDPHTEAEKNLSAQIYKNDLEALSKFPNVIFL